MIGNKGKISMNVWYPLLVRIRCLFSRVERSNVDFLSVYYGSGAPSTTIAGNAFVSACIVSRLTSIPSVLGYGAFANVFSAIIQSVVIFMVADLGRFKPKYRSMHFHGRLFPINKRFPLGIVSFSPRTPDGTPIPLREPLKISGVHDGILSLRKGNEFNRLIFWLRNGVARHSSLWHVPTSIGICNAAILP